MDELEVSEYSGSRAVIFLTFSGYKHFCLVAILCGCYTVLQAYVKEI